MWRSSRSIAYESRATSSRVRARSCKHARAATTAVERRRAAEAAAGRRLGLDVDVEPDIELHALDRRLREVHHAVVLGPWSSPYSTSCPRSSDRTRTWRSVRGETVTRT